MTTIRIQTFFTAFVLCTSIAAAQQFVVSTVAGAPPLATRPVPARSVSIGYTGGLATDRAGNTLFNSRGAVPGESQIGSIFRLDPKGILTRIAGVPVLGFYGDGGPAIAAEFNNVGGLATDSWGNL
jgi:hypothetical protein